MPDADRPPAPIVRWAGGKQYIVRVLRQHLPRDVASRHYHEPFLGGGALFFAVAPRKASLSDANQHLIRCYEAVRDDPLVVQRYLRGHARKTSERHYYRVRALYNAPQQATIAQAARFLYLNRTCFNGIFRVNLRGQFNVPYGFKDPPPLPELDLLRSVSTTLSKVKLRCSTFEKALEDVRNGDFVYLDPPYPPLNGTSFFAHYTADRFDSKNQKRVASLARALDRAGALVLVSNADTPDIRKLYRWLDIDAIPVRRYITCKTHKHAVSELVMRNY